MSHTVVELFVKVVPVDLFRNGVKNSPQLHKLRTMPPRTLLQSYDIKLFKRDGIDYVDKDSGGISTFEKELNGLSGAWWRIPRGTKIPAGLRISKDHNTRPTLKPTHYTIRPLLNMPLAEYVSLLESLARSAERVIQMDERKSGGT